MLKVLPSVVAAHEGDYVMVMKGMVSVGGDVRSCYNGKLWMIVVVMVMVL